MADQRMDPHRSVRAAAQGSIAAAARVAGTLELMKAGPDPSCNPNPKATQRMMLEPYIAPQIHPHAPPASDRPHLQDQSMRWVVFRVELIVLGLPILGQIA